MKILDKLSDSIPTTRYMVLFAWVFLTVLAVSNMTRHYDSQEWFMISVDLLCIGIFIRAIRTAWKHEAVES